MAKLSRLMFIADHCPSLRIETLKMAITAVQETYNVTLYQQLHRKLQEAISGYVLHRLKAEIMSLILVLI